MSVVVASEEPFLVPDALPPNVRLTRLVQDTHSFVFRILRRFGLPAADAEDAAQQVFLVASSRLADIVPGKERAFLFRTAMHVAAKAHRTRRRRPEDANEDCGDGADGAPGPEELVQQRRAREILDRILEDMELELKTVIVLFEIEGLTMSEIAEATDVPPGTVASRLRRARAELVARVRREPRLGPGGSP
ncbi:MAG TPA: sigma-70 family RNA polymerase sigma factor [Polyangiaceae bacterium]|nr:sigma-70 family RNA polymerase sigma factor [Polyangiaceae bacterium]